MYYHELWTNLNETPITLYQKVEIYFTKPSYTIAEAILLVNVRYF